MSGIHKPERSHVCVHALHCTKHDAQVHACVHAYALVHRCVHTFVCICVCKRICTSVCGRASVCKHNVQPCVRVCVRAYVCWGCTARGALDALGLLGASGLYTRYVVMHECVHAPACACMRSRWFLDGYPPVWSRAHLCECVRLLTIADMRECV